ncbi:GT2 family glycosyltransferase [Luteibacter sp. OK325]|uniref:glycosyltransferase family 2 protein n=1 Tax=Luteibacter sp. OK325 TaxID=2135670 RepID=UPI000D379754|nr:glycosyltransferase family 2 protein [Luteibacter sp. OK325]PTR33450.1 GT2 family glycosyltransferase [Luteibacter sp. OK325]
MSRISMSLAGSPGILVDYQPIHQLTRCETSGLFRATGEDPQVLLHLPDGTLGPGFHRISVELSPVDGSLGKPLLYVHNEPFLLRPRMYGTEWTAIVLAPATGTTHVRLDPSDREATFMLGDILIESLTEQDAIHELTEELRRRPPVGFVFGSTVLGDQADALYKRYVAGNAVALGGGSEQPAGTYQEWVAQFDTPDANTVSRWRQEVLGWSRRPFISILVPVYNTAEQWLRACLDSVRAQAYPDWELCIVDDASPEPHVRRVLEEYAAGDSRIRLCFRDENGHISRSSNSALAMARGDFVALLDHDDALPPHALLEVARVLAARPDVGIVYSDEDKIDEAGVRFDPYFKPAWNPDLFLSQNYVSHFGAYRTSLVREVGGFRIGYEGSQDYDLALRCIERLSDQQIVHVPQVLYHWRAIAGSTALALGEKNYAVDAGQRALTDHLQRKGVEAVVTPSPGGYRIRRALPAKLPTVELIIPTRDRVDLVRMCVESILAKTAYAAYSIIIVDNGSVEQETLEYFAHVSEDPRVRVIRDDSPFNYSRLNNRAVRESAADIVGLINNDIEVISADWLDEMVSQAVRPEVGVVGAMLYYPNDTIQHAGVILGMHGVAGHVYSGAERGHNGQMGRARLVQNLTAVTAACLLIRRDVWDDVQGLDETLTVAFNDIDLCLRVIRAGYVNVWTPFAELYHHESASRGNENTPEKKVRFLGEIATMDQRWSSWYVADPAHNPNLSLYAFAMVPSFPPRPGIARLGGRQGVPQSSVA